LVTVEKPKNIGSVKALVGACGAHLVTDELVSYEPIGREFAGHTTVNHSADEYGRLGR